MDRNDLSICPEMDYFMDESVSDVVFVVEGQRIPAMKSILGFKSKVFRAMFGGDFKESEDKEIVIEDTTYEAFKTFIQFLYCDRLVLKDNKDFKLIEEVCQLSDRYDVKKLLEKVDDNLMAMTLSCSDSVTFNWVSKIAFDYKILGIKAKVLTLIEENIKHFMKKADKELHELDVLTHNHLTGVLARSYRKLSTEYDRKNEQLNEFNRYLKEYQKIKCFKCNSTINSYLFVPGGIGTYFCKNHRPLIFRTVGKIYVNSLLFVVNCIQTYFVIITYV